MWFGNNSYLCIARTRQASPRCSNVRVVLYFVDHDRWYSSCLLLSNSFWTSYRTLIGHLSGHFLGHLSAIFVVFSQKSHLNRIFICFSLALYCMDISELFAFLSELFSELSLLPYGWELLQRTSNCSRSFQKIFQIHIIYNNKHEYCHLFIKRLAF